MAFGCPQVGTPQCADNNYCAPFHVYDPTLHPLGTCNPLSRVAGSAYADCVQTHSTNGTKRAQIVGAIADLIVVGGTCSPNRWSAYQSGTPIPGGDPRAITLVITQPADLSQNSLTVPIRNFATFYVTGWDTGGGIPSCNGLPPSQSNEALCSGSCKKSALGAIWGHWVEYTDPNLIGNGTLALLRNPAQWERLRGDPSLGKTAVEELLRYESPLATATERNAKGWTGASASPRPLSCTSDRDFQGTPGCVV